MTSQSQTDEIFASARWRMEAASGLSLAAVRLCDLPAAETALAVTRGENIALAPRFYGLAPARQHLILAHELVHVAQKRAGAAGVPAAAPEALEAEASVLAIRALAGRRVQIQLADRPERSAAWGEAGHYWASLYIMLAAGVPQATAQRRAFFCQMPDEVLEFDAIAAAVDYITSGERGPGSLPVLGAPATDPQDIRWVEQTRWVHDGMARFRETVIVEDSHSRAMREQTDRQISSGLHCLTGRRGADEVAFRRENLIRYVNDEVRFGLALHCFGDSYAHQDDNHTMYPPIRGHGLAGHAPDSIHDHASNFAQYIGALYGIASRLLATRTVAIEPRVVFRRLLEVANMTFDGNDERQQVEYSRAIRSLIYQMQLAAPHSLDAYQPENESIRYWRQFHPRHTNQFVAPTPDQVFQIVRQCGREWFLI